MYITGQAAWVPMALSLTPASPVNIIYIYLCIYLSICVYMYIYIYIYTYTYI